MSRLEDLWEGWLTDALTPEEVSEFQGRVAQADPETIALLDDMLQNGAYQGLAHPEKEELIFRRILLLTRQRSRTIPLFPRIAAAAAILLMLCTGGYFLFLHKPSQTAHAPASPFTNDLAPGGNKAILTLSNGQKIILDSAANGLIAQQGNSTIQKLAAGQLTYKNGFPRSGKSFKSSESWSNTLTTPRGGQYQLILPDGTKVWLNAASSIRYPTAFTGKTREVTITGEAYFEVAHREKQPFHVKAGNTLIQDLGTHFNINAYSDEPDTKTSLLEGSIRITDKNNSLVLHPGQEAIVNPTARIQLDPDPNMEEIMAWKNGLFQFNHADIETVMRQVSRWYDVEVVFEGPKPAGHFGGKISRNVNASQMLQVLAVSGLHFRIEGRKLIITA
jgi:transmembrane sensor